MRSFDELVVEFIATPKLAVRKPRWKTKNHPDFAALTLGVVVEGKRHLRGTVAISAHRMMMPPKYSFALIFRRYRVLALDVNPGRFHRNLLAKGSVSVTHWQQWPGMEAESDKRDLTFSVWLHEFLVRANVTCNYHVVSPPRGRQLDFLNGTGPIAR